jgi:D-beta-D-heptose 7-phosphate kinase/D-beta-D-heptose 1-phosphate adenosyltransferase
MVSYPDFSRSKVVVVGDVMLDRYILGDVERISPEAPVPVVKVKQRSEILGGAGNVASNLAGLACPVCLIGIRGDDAYGACLADLLRKTPIDYHILVDSSRPTITKERVLAHNQQLLRIDEEDSRQLSASIQDHLLKTLKDILADYSALILSDYGKGIFQTPGMAQELIQMAKDCDIPVLVDPKGKDWERYRGATCITPNTEELERVSQTEVHHSDSTLEVVARSIRQRLDLGWLLVTRGSKGMCLIDRNDASFFIPAEAREVYDVSGAGDTVIAILAACRAAGLSMSDAAKVANVGAGIVVGKLGTQPINHIELKRAVRDGAIIGSRKICSRSRAREIISAWRSEGNRIVFTNGCFDILHIGHIKLLHAAAEEGDKLVVGLNSDTSVRRLKGNSRPVMSEEERSAVLASIKGVDLVVVFEEDTPIELIRNFKPEVLVKGGDYTPQTVVGHEIVESQGGKVVIVPLIEGVSTTRVISDLQGNSN